MKSNLEPRSGPRIFVGKLNKDTTENDVKVEILCCSKSCKGSNSFHQSYQALQWVSVLTITERGGTTWHASLTGEAWLGLHVNITTEGIALPSHLAAVSSPATRIH